MLSIITVNLNNLAGLRKTIESVLSQKSANYEYIIIDGASRDGSADAIRECEARLAYWVSEPDTGVYAAMNKGIRAATGDYCLFLNSGDWLMDEEVVGYLASRTVTGSDVYYADLPRHDRPGEYIAFPRELDLRFLITGSINHQNTVIRRESLLKFGLYREDFRIISDWHFYLKTAWRDRARFEYLDRSIAYYIHEGLSADPRHARGREAERDRALVDIFGDLAPTIIEFFRYRHSVYYNIIHLWGYTRSLEFFLKAYRYVMRRIKRLFPRQVA